MKNHTVLTTLIIVGSLYNTSYAASNIKDQYLSNFSSSCVDHINDYYANVSNQYSDRLFKSSVSISVNEDECIIRSNGIPNYDFNDQSFHSAVRSQNDTYRISTQPQKASAPQALEMNASAIFLNGVKVDLLAAACFGEVRGRDRLGSEKIGCGPRKLDHPWRYDPMSPLNGFKTDEHNAHTQPNGAYHYHGNPQALFNQNCDSAKESSPVIGFAADGFPIFGSCISNNGKIEKAKPSYQLKNNGGKRQLISGYETPKAGIGQIASNNYDGQFRSDWEYVAGSGDLDECNGMTNSKGQYGYYITNSFPWVMNCFTGIKNENF